MTHHLIVAAVVVVLCTLLNMQWWVSAIAAAVTVGWMLTREAEQKARESDPPTRTQPR